MTRNAAWCCCCGVFLFLAVQHGWAQSAGVSSPTAGVQQDSTSVVTNVSSAAVTPSIPPAAGQRVHRVWLWQESRDCLWNLAKKYYGDPWQWKKIYLANRNQINNPAIIYPKQVLVIPPLDETEK